MLNDWGATLPTLPHTAPDSVPPNSIEPGRRLSSETARKLVPYDARTQRLSMMSYLPATFQISPLILSLFSDVCRHDAWKFRKSKTGRSVWA